MVDWTPLHDPMEPIAHRVDLLGEAVAKSLDGVLMRLVLMIQNARAPDAALDFQVRDYVAAIAGRGKGLGTSHGCTTSLDHAVALMPSNWCWEVGRLSGGSPLFYANVWADQDAYRVDHFTAATPALAMCCAAVMARHRAHQQGTERPSLHLVV